MNAQLLSAAERLPVDERLELVEAIWDSISRDAQALPLPESHRRMLDGRLSAFHADPDAGSDWDEVEARLESLD